MPKPDRNNFAVFLYALILAVVGVLMQLAFQFTAAVPVDAALAVLMTLAFFVGPLELAGCGALAYVLLAWRPSPSPELALFVGFPIAFYFIRQVLPWRPLALSAAAVVAGIGAFYLLLDYRTARAHLPELALSAAIGICIALAAYTYMKRMTGTKT